MSTANPAPSHPPPSAVLTRLGLFSLVWLVVAGADPMSWVIGVPAVALATLAALKLATQRADHPRTMGIIRFVPFFLAESIRGGIDVASRVMRPSMRISPGVRSYALRLTGPNARVFFLDSISLLPGTLSADMRNGVLYVHALDIHDDIDASLQRLEVRVADLFGELDLLNHSPEASTS